LAEKCRVGYQEAFPHFRSNTSRYNAGPGGVGVALLGTAVIGSAAFAQSTQPADRAAPAANAPPAQAKMALKGNWRASKLMGLNVYNEANEKLGDVNELLVDKSGKISAVVIGIGFLGIGRARHRRLDGEAEIR
jgi:hypothetical protein